MANKNMGYAREWLVTVSVESFQTVMAHDEETARAKVLKNAESTYGRTRTVTIKSVQQV